MNQNKETKSIFRYRSSNINNLYDLINDTITGGPIYKFNDDFDSSGCINIELFQRLKEIIRIASKKDSIKEYQLNMNIGHLFKQLKIACFSKNKMNTAMWNHYAEQSKGMCFEYDYNDINKIVEKYELENLKYYNKYSKNKITMEEYKKTKRYERCFFEEINYNNELIDVTHVALDQLMINEKIGDEEIYDTNNEFLQKLFESRTLPFREKYNFLLQKNKNWEYEEECRLICLDTRQRGVVINAVEEFATIGKAKVKKIYLGTHVSNSLEEVIKYFCKIKKIPLIKFENNFSCKNYGLNETSLYNPPKTKQA